MKREFFPTDGDGKPPFGTVFNWPEKYASALDAAQDGVPVLMFLHGIGKPCQGTGTLKELQALVGWGGFGNGFFWLENGESAVDFYNIIIVLVQTNTGYAKGEIQFLLDKVKKELRPKTKPTLQGASWGGFGAINNINSGALNPKEISSIWLLSPGGDGNIGGNFAAKMKGSNVQVYCVHNEKDGEASVKQSQLIYDSMSALGSPVGFVKFKNEWKNESHATWAWVFPGRWHMYIAQPLTPEVKAASNFAELFEFNVDITFNFYEMMKRDLKPAADQPVPVVDKLLMTQQILQRADGSVYAKNI